MVILRSINIIHHSLKNPHCFSKISMWQFCISWHLHLVLSFLTIISFLTTTSYSTTALGPLLDALDRCVGFFNLTLLSGSPHCAPGNCYFFSHDVLLLRLLLEFKALDPQSFLVKEGVTCYLCRMSYYCRSTTSSTPYNLLKPWTFGQQKPFFGWFLILRPHCHFLW